MYEMVHECIVNDCPKFECWKSSDKWDTEVRTLWYVNKARVLHLFTNIVNYGKYHSIDNLTSGKQDKLIQ